jgi:hypothetical protein
MPSYEIVGMHFRPPAKGLIKGIETDQTLYLRAEPANPFDPNAIQVILKTKDIPESSYENITNEVSGFGKDISDILSQPDWHLGYIRKEVAAILRQNQIVIPNQEVEAKFSLNFSGKPLVSI